MTQHTNSYQVWQRYERAMQQLIGIVNPTARQNLLAMEPHVKALPTILNNDLDKPATPSTIIRARILFLQYLIDQFALYPHQTHPRDEDILAITRLAFDGVTALLKTIEAIEKNCTKEQRLELLKGLGLTTQAAITQFNRDSLTIDDILLFEPGIIINVTL